MLVERLAGDPWLDHDVEILGVHRQHRLHVAEVDRDAAEGRVDMTLERGAGPKRDHRHAMRRADAHDLLHVGRVLRKHHRVRRLVGDPGGGVAVLLAHRLRGDETIAEARGECCHRSGERLGIAPFMADWCDSLRHR